MKLEPEEMQFGFDVLNSLWVWKNNLLFVLWAN